MTLFSVIRAVLLKPLAYRDPDRLAKLSSSNATPVRVFYLEGNRIAFAQTFE